MKRYLSVIYLLLIPAIIMAGDRIMDNRSISLELRPDYIVPTNEFIKNRKLGGGINSAVSPHLRYSFSFSPSTKYGQLYRNVYQGIGLSYMATMPVSTLGHPVSLYLFQGARIATIGQRMWLGYEWNFGLSLGWDRYDSEKRPDNWAVGSKLNAMLGLGLVMHYRLNDSWNLSLGVGGTHFSDGNTRLPNPGINLLGARLGVAYTIDGTNNRQQIGSSGTNADFDPSWGLDVLIYGAPRQRVVTDSRGYPMFLDHSFAVGGIDIAPMYAVNRYLRIGGSLDMQYDTSVSLDRNRVPGTYDDNPLFFRQTFAERFSMGLSAHAELTMPIFSINAGIGRNIIAGSPDTKIFYQTLALKIKVFHGLFINIGYQLRNFHEPNNLMLGAGYSFGK